MKIGLVQYNPERENKKKNREKLNSLLSHNLKEDKLLIFPEMSLTGFTMKASGFAEATDGESFRYFAEIAAGKNIHVLCGIIEEEEGKFFNTLLHINGDGELVNKYRKIHPFSYSTEDKHYVRGEEPVTTLIEGWKTGLSICYDLRFPELYRNYAKVKSDLMIVIANWPDTRIEHWRTLLKARAVENQCYVAGVNRVGNDPKLHYNGYSSVFDPMGNEIISCADEEKVVTAEISLQNVEEVRTRLPFLNDIFLI